MNTGKAQPYAVLAALFILSLITYIDRAAISSAKGAMAAELSLSDQSMGAVFSAFALGYALAQIPSGWLADRIGPRLALTAVAVVWSLLTSLTGMVWQFGALLLVRFLFGVAEAGAFPGAARVFYNWLPPGKRGIANGILFSGGLLGGAAAFPFFHWLLSAYGWRYAFYFLGIPGLAWAVCWLVWFRDYPRERMVEKPAAAASQGSFGEVFRSRAMAVTMFQYFAGNFTFFLCISWMHPYLVERYRISPEQASGYSMIPLILGATANWVSGFFVDYLYRAGFRAWSRRLPAVCGFLLAAASVGVLSLAGSSTTAVAAFAAATFGVEMTISPSWAYCLDIGGKNAGAVSASMNMVGNFGGFVSANAFPLLHSLTGSSAAYFRAAACLNIVAILCWLMMGPKGHACRLPGKA